MRKYMTVTLVALTVLITIAVNATSASDNTCSRTNVCNVVNASYKCNNWSDEQYPMISLFGEEDVPLFAEHDDVWNSHVNKLARLILNSNASHILKTGEKLDLGRGYAIKVKQIDADSGKVWF